MTRTNDGFKNVSSYVKEDTYQVFKDMCKETGFSVNQRIKLLIYDDLDLLPFGFYTWPVSDQTSYLRGK